MHLVEDAKDLLHVMADLVRDDIGLGEIARRAEALLELVEEAEVDVEVLVLWDNRTARSPRLRTRRPSSPGR